MNNNFDQKNALEYKIQFLTNMLIERKNKTSNYYESLYQKTSKAQDNYELKKIANEIILSSGRIEDLANFNYKEKNALEEIFLLSQEILSYN